MIPRTRRSSRSQRNFDRVGHKVASGAERRVEAAAGEFAVGLKLGDYPAALRRPLVGVNRPTAGTLKQVGNV